MAAKEFSFTHQHVVITGASSGLGAELAEQIAKRGGRVTLIARRKKQLDDVAARIIADGGSAFAVPADVTDQSAIQAAIDDAMKEHGPVDVLIANAGVSPNMSVAEMDVALIQDTMKLNFFGVVYAVNAVLPQMIERKSGTVLAISSVAAFRGIPTMAPYCASKSAVTAWMESLRSELDHMESGVRMVTSHPGYIRTSMTADTEADMPFLLDVDTAAGLLIGGLNSDTSQIDFPWQLIAMFRVACRLPNRLYDRVISGTATNPFTWGDAMRDAVMWVVGGLVLFSAVRYYLTNVADDIDPVWRITGVIALPFVCLTALVFSGRVRRSAKVPVLIVVMGTPIVLITGILAWIGVW